MDATATQSYIDLLEKTNQQLSLWYNPYAIMVAALTALVAVMAISFAFILWRQGREYKETIKTFFDEQRKLVEAEITKMREEGKKTVDETLAKVEKEAKSTTGAAKVKIDKQIEELKKLSEDLNKPAPLRWLPPYTAGDFIDFTKKPVTLSSLTQDPPDWSLATKINPRYISPSKEKAIEDLEIQMKEVLSRLQKLNHEEVEDPKPKESHEDK